LARPWEITDPRLRKNRKSKSLTAYYTNLPRRDLPAFPATQAINRLEGSSRGARLELGGADQGTVREETSRPEFEVAKTAADVFPDIRAESPKPALVSLFDFLQRGSSGFVGLQSGLQGLDRPGGLRPGNAEDRILPGESLTDVGLRRFKQGWSGEEIWRAADFGAIAEKKALGTASRLELGYQASTGFIMDTVLDPITYMSFGGSIMGRRIAAQKVEGYVQRALNEGLEVANKEGMLRRGVEYGAISEDAIAARMNSMVEDRIIKLRKTSRDEDLLWTTRQNAKKLADDLEATRSTITPEGLPLRFDPSDSLDTTLAKSRLYSWYDDAGKVYSLIDDFVKTTAPEHAAWAYLNRGAGGLRRWAIFSFGREAGENYFKSLPKDIQGGIRLRMPFYRDKNGVPLAMNIPGIGAGRLSEKSKIVRGLSEFSERSRELMRNSIGRVPMKYLSGEAGDVLYAALRSWGVKARQAEIPDGGRVTYNDYTNRLKMQAIASIDEKKLRSVMAQGHLEATSLYTQGIERYGQEAFHEKWARFFYDNDYMKSSMPRYIGGLMDAEEATAFQSARLWRETLDDYGDQILEAFNWNADEAAFFVQNFVPRRETEEMIRMRLNSLGMKRSATDPKYIKHRSAFAESWELKPDGDAFILRFNQPDDINNMYSRYYGVDQIYKVDPREYMGIYLAELNSSLLDQKLLNFAKRTGVLRQLDTSTYGYNEFINPHMVQERIAEALIFDPKDSLSGTGWARVLKDRLINEHSMLNRPDGEALPGSLVSQAERASQLLRGNIEDATMRYGIAGPRRIDFDSYVIDRNLPGSWINEADNTRIIRNQDNSWSAVNVNGDAIRNADGSPLSYYPTQMELDIDGGLSAGLRVISDILASIPEVKAYRDFIYVNEVARLRSAVMDRIDEFVSRFETPSQIFANLDMVPVSEHGDIVQATVNSAYRWLKKFGADKGRFDLTKDGIPKDIEKALMERTQIRSNAHAQWLERSGYTSLLSPDLESLGWAGKTVPQMKSMVRKHMEETYAPAAIAASMRRLFAVYDNPETWGRMLVRDVYLPFYAMQKVGMTLFRGPGFIMRNIQGGMWNGHLDGVGRADWKHSSQIILMFRRAQQNVIDRVGKETFSLQPETSMKQVEEELLSLAKSTFKGRESFIPNTDDADAVVEIYKMFVNNGMSRGAKMTQLTSELLDNFNAMRGGRTTSVPVLGADGKVKQVSVQTGRSDGGIDVLSADEMNAFQRVNQYLAFDNPWISKIMGPATEYAEDYLRLAAFIKGVREVGLEPAETGIRGYAASWWVKGTQFDYSDLSQFERQVMKYILPFYTWTRYNIPLQVRAIVHDPAKVSQVLRIKDSMAYIFGDDNVEASPSFLTERLGFEIPQQVFDWLPEKMQPAGNVGLGLFIGEPITDVARWFRTPTQGVTLNPLNMREIEQNLNPLVRILFAGSAYLEGDPTIDRKEQESLPGWAKWIPRATPGVNYDIDREEKTTNRYVLEIIRSAFPQLGVIERVIPGAGTERHGGRWFTSILSSTLGLPANTVDGWVRASEQERRTQMVKDQLKYMYGSESTEYRVLLIRSLMDAGAPVEFIEMLDIPSMEKENVDIGQALATWEYVQSIGYMYLLGYDPNEIALAMNLSAPYEAGSEDWVRQIYEAMQFSSDADRNRFLREFGPKKISPDRLKELGISQRQLREMSDEELNELILQNTYRIARERTERERRP
jgi:hypothetical protein